jgi:MYXO-CTERM domain-containing protein
MKAGKKQTLKWTQSSSQARYELDMEGKGVRANFSFEVSKSQLRQKAGKLQVRSSREDIVKRHKTVFETPFDLARYEFKIYDGDGEVVAAGQSKKGVAANSTFTISWNSPADVFMVWVRGEDHHGQFSEYKLVPWSVEIPHTEINFDTGKADIKPNEANKLDEAVAVAFHELDALERVNKAVNANISPRLYIVGYTDSVGSTASNDKLSLDRARSIAKYFHSQGFWAPIYYGGLGERSLRVETGDNVDEERNRRALYLIGVDQPPPGGQIPASWKKLSGGHARPAGFTLPPLPERWANYREERRIANLTGGSEGGGGGDDTESTDDSSPGSFDNSADDRDPTYPDDVGGGPPPVEGEPGATKKGCSVHADAPAPLGLALGWLVLVAAARRRRR